MLTLLKRGRVGPALAQLARLPQLIHDEMREAVAEAYEQGQLDLAREITGDAKVKRQPTLKRHQWLAQRIADPELRARARAVLRLGDELLDRVLAGTVQLSGTQWRRLRQELGG